MAKKTKSALEKWISRIRVGAATVLVRGKTKKAAKANASRFRKRHLKNVEMGFWSGGSFHPIRASGDYKPGMAGEGGSKRAKAVRAGKSRRKRISRVIGR